MLYLLCTLDLNSKTFETNSSELRIISALKKLFWIMHARIGPVIFRNISFSEVSE